MYIDTFTTQRPIRIGVQITYSGLTKSVVVLRINIRSLVVIPSKFVLFKKKFPTTYRMS